MLLRSSLLLLWRVCLIFELIASLLVRQMDTSQIGT